MEYDSEILRLNLLISKRSGEFQKQKFQKSFAETIIFSAKLLVKNFFQEAAQSFKKSETRDLDG
ncbi:MAG: hypothetical protein M3384_00530 [Acidobacteriota bacterium]|nr:hypothetical protein [Acidobacteriota bacterium]